MDGDGDVGDGEGAGAEAVGGGDGFEVVHDGGEVVLEGGGDGGVGQRFRGSKANRCRSRRRFAALRVRRG